jgi:hypothetical protein
MPQPSFSLVRRASSHAFGIFGALLVHAIFLQAVTLGASSAKRRPLQEDRGPGASAILSSTGEWMTLVMVQTPKISPAQSLEDVASRGLAPSNAAIRIVSPDPTPAFAMEDAAQADDSAEVTQTSSDPAIQSLLFGRYTGQISARIERSWRRPRSAVSTETATDTFRCQARIAQDARGNVEEIELISCNGTVLWQQSLVSAIQQASPLPAPPSPTVFTNALTLVFEARTYAPGSPEGEYEPLFRRLASELSNAASLTYPPTETGSDVQTEIALDRDETPNQCHEADAPLNCP